MALSALCSTLDSSLSAFGSLWSTELSTSKDRINVSRKAMLILSLFGLIIALGKFSIITLWFTASTIRLSVFFPTIQSILNPQFNYRKGSYGIIISLLIGGVIFLIGIVNSNALVKTIGMISTVAISILITSLSNSQKR